MTFDHIGVIAPDMSVGRTMLAEAFGIERWTAVFEDRVNDVAVRFGLDGSGICYEAIAPLSDHSPVSRALRHGVNIVNHTAYRVDDIAEAGRRLRRAGFSPTGKPRPAIAFGGGTIQFFMDRHRLMLELIEAPGHRHQFLPNALAGAPRAAAPAEHPEMIGARPS